MPRGRNRVGLLDLMILVAACAGAAAVLRLYLEYEKSQGFVAEQSWAEWLASPHAWRLVALPLMPLSLGGLAMHLRLPRACLKAMRPGFLACCPTAVVAGLSLAIQGTAMLIVGPPSDATGYLFSRVILWWPYPIAMASCVLWCGALVSRRWRPEPSPADRAGRLVGAAWVVLFLAWSCEEGYSHLSVIHFVLRTPPAPVGTGALSSPPSDQPVDPSIPSDSKAGSEQPESETPRL